MSVSLLEVIEAAGYDIRNNVDDANWLLGQDLGELYEEAESLVDEHEEWEDAREIAEDDGEHNFPTFNEWREMKGEQ